MDIKQRIAEILTSGDDHICDSSAKVLADAIVDELGLRQEWFDDVAGPDWQRYSRWVTEMTKHPGPDRIAAGLA